MTIADREIYARHRSKRAVRHRDALVYEWGLPMLLFGSVGAITWAIRGTGGWGGIDGTIIPGLTWGLLWYYVCRRKGIDARAIVLWLGLGIALGGELGYGQYISWIRGQFHVAGQVIPVSPWTGYLWLVICGIGWGAPGGVLLGWTLNRKLPVLHWIIRLSLGFVLLALIFDLDVLHLGAGIVDGLAECFRQHCPWMLFPNANREIYSGALGHNLQRTIYTNTQNFTVLVWWAVAILVAAFQKDRATLVCGAVISGGFGIGFALAAIWTLGYGFAPRYIDWWKLWELTAGFFLGLLYVIALHWTIREVDKTCEATGPTPNPRKDSITVPEWGKSLFWALGGFVLVFAAGYEYFFWVGIGLGALYVAAILAVTPWSARSASDRTGADERRKSVTLVYSVFLLLFILAQGASSQTGILLGLYTAKDADQYAWPVGRIVLFVPVATVLVGATLVSLKRALRTTHSAGIGSLTSNPVPARMFDLLTFIGVVGAASIWPAKIGVLYAVLLCFAIFALTRLNRHFDAIDLADRAT